MEPYYHRLQTKHQIVAEKDQNAILKDWIPSAAAAAGVQANPDWNACPSPGLGAGFLDVGYDPATCIGYSSSVAYLDSDQGPAAWPKHPHRDLPSLRQPRERPRRLGHHRPGIRADREIVVCRGSVDTPRLLLLSGIGPADDLPALG